MRSVLCSVGMCPTNRSPVLHPYAAARRPRDNASGRLERAALALVADGWTTELQATVIHERIAPTIVGYTVAAITAVLISPAWPIFGAVLAAAVTLGGGVDLVGGRSWVRGLTPRRGHRNVLLWSGTKPPDPTPGPWPGVEAPDQTRRQVLLVIPDHPGGGRLSNVTALGAFFGLFALAAIFAIQMVHPSSATNVTAVAASFLLLVSMVAFAVDRRRQSPRSVPGVAAARALVEQLPTAVSARIGIIIVGGLSPWFDGVETLLFSRRRRHPRQHTDIVVWHPGRGQLSRVDRDGVFGRRAPPHLVHAAAEIPPARPRRLRPWRTAALRARRMGWPALGLVGGSDDAQSIAAVAHLLHTLAGPR